MALPVTIEISFPDLPDADVWFANAQAANTFFSSATGSAVIDPADTDAYVPAPYNSNLVPADVNIDGVEYILVTKAMFDSLLVQLDALDTNYQNLKSGLQDAGIISNA